MKLITILQTANFNAIDYLDLFFIILLIIGFIVAIKRHFTKKTVTPELQQEQPNPIEVKTIVDLDLFTPLTKEFLQDKSADELFSIACNIYAKSNNIFHFLHQDIFSIIKDYNYERVGDEIGNENIIFIGKDFFDKKAVENNDILCIEKRKRDYSINFCQYQVVIHLKNSDEILFATYPNNIYKLGTWIKDFKLDEIYSIQLKQNKEQQKQQLINQLT